MARRWPEPYCEYCSGRVGPTRQGCDRCHAEYQAINAICNRIRMRFPRAAQMTNVQICKSLAKRVLT